MSLIHCQCCWITNWEAVHKQRVNFRISRKFEKMKTPVLTLLIKRKSRELKLTVVANDNDLNATYIYMYIPKKPIRSDIPG